MKKKIIVSIVAVFAALAAGAWAIAKFVKRGSKKISEDLDYDENYLGDEDYTGGDEVDLAETSENQDETENEQSTEEPEEDTTITDGFDVESLTEPEEEKE
ncbi:hypothetical protein [Clostridium facile]|uniref:Uncharacterized protein n=1 Tax=Clostridium facile TaxID=2763035 RepID=A0ABR7IN81_9CLOT|nr:hypothetical protein [Clostridium facile]MBC5786589.1 hypothetical protein [Clostridium facile]